MTCPGSETLRGCVDCLPGTTVLCYLPAATGSDGSGSRSFAHIQWRWQESRRAGEQIHSRAQLWTDSLSQGGLASRFWEACCEYRRWHSAAGLRVPSDGDHTRPFS